MEHTLLKYIRRKFYIEEFKNVTNREIDIYCIFSSNKQYEKNCEQRNVIGINVTDNLELPSYDEGFSNIYFVNENEIYKENLNR